MPHPFLDQMTKGNFGVQPPPLGFNPGGAGPSMEPEESEIQRKIREARARGAQHMSRPEDRININHRVRDAAHAVDPEIGAQLNSAAMSMPGQGRKGYAYAKTADGREFTMETGKRYNMDAKAAEATVQRILLARQKAENDKRMADERQHDLAKTRIPHEQKIAEMTLEDKLAQDREDREWKRGESERQRRERLLDAQTTAAERDITEAPGRKAAETLANLQAEKERLEGTGLRDPAVRDQYAGVLQRIKAADPNAVATDLSVRDNPREAIQEFQPDIAEFGKFVRDLGTKGWFDGFEPADTAEVQMRAREILQDAKASGFGPNALRALAAALQKQIAAFKTEYNPDEENLPSIGFNPTSLR